MKTRPCILLCTLALGALAQSFTTTPAFRGAAAIQGIPPQADNVFSPTNIAGSPAVAWYVSGNYYTNGSTATLPDSSGNGRHCTNSTAPNFPSLQVSALCPSNGLWYSGAVNNMNLRCNSMTNEQPFEVCVVCIITNDTANSRDIFGFSDGGGYLMDHASDAKCWIAAGSARVAGYVTTNQICVINAIFNAASSAVYTNNVSAGSFASPGTNKMAGITIGNAGGLGVPLAGIIYEMAIYTNVLSSGDRTLLYQFETNRYHL